MMNLETALNEYAAMKQELAPMLAQLEALEKAIKAHVLETGEIADTESASIKLRTGYERTSWDNKALQGYAAAHPEILQFASTTHVGTSVVIQVKK